ncbi:YdaU family protein [Bradyrhizobium arachidis]|uniref:DUF1376 domain-containing protein n=1 Tax=Bradyrhizobium arachidis TaxID=858423 RepID=A0AAE7NSU0_9BRAD|nr:DUF1376 domain-containing protein [Bradyrhizobium arachidis]QOZ68865.1 DUF1376 domain-containing protein [Bradyrhizobium arachidis]SFV19264.1 Protein of unknown function [Bradyrhizobium arachidis]
MVKLPWFPIHVGDYLADTGHLSPAQHGAYMLLLLHSWKTGALADDDEQLANITRMTADEWRANRATLLRFFHKDCNEGWRSARLEHERQRAQETSQRRSLAGSKGGTKSAMNRLLKK